MNLLNKYLLLMCSASNHGDMNHPEHKKLAPERQKIWDRLSNKYKDEAYNFYYVCIKGLA